MQPVNNNGSQKTRVADVLTVRICRDLAGGSLRAGGGWVGPTQRGGEKGGAYITPRATKPNPPATRPTLKYPKKDNSTQIRGEGGYIK